MSTWQVIAREPATAFGVDQSCWIDPTARISSTARISLTARIGPWCSLGAGTVIGAQTTLRQNVIVVENTSLGARNDVHPFAVLGGPPQQVKKEPSDGLLLIGDDNIIREHVTINVGTPAGGMRTTIGDGNLIMAGCHIGHDATIGNSCIIASGSCLAGHVTVENATRIGGNVALAEWVRVGSHAFIGGQSGIDRDIPPFCVAFGVRPERLRGCNLKALRKKFDREAVRTIYAIVKTWMDVRLSKRAAVELIARNHGDHPAVQVFLSFVANSRVGVMR